MPPAFLHPRQTSDQSLNSSRFADVWRVLAQIQLPGCMMHLMYAIYPALSHLRNGICGCLRLCANLCMVSVISCLWLLQEATLQCLQSRHVTRHSHQALFVVMHRLARPGRAADCLPGMGRNLLLTACHPGLRFLRLMASQVYSSATLKLSRSG